MSLFSLYLVATRLNKILNFMKSSHQLQVNQQCLICELKCDLCNAGYVGFSRQSLHQCVEEHKNLSSSIGKHFCEKHCLAPKDLGKNFNVLKKYKNKFDCLMHENDLFFYPHHLTLE